MKVLDAGCGVGGTAIYIAKKTGAKVWGITLSQNQVNLANKYSNVNSVANLTDFSKQDYHQTNFPENFFDFVYGIESICHAHPKSKFLREAFRILKPGGRIIIADGYCSRTPRTQHEKKIIKEFVSSYALKELITTNKMEREIKKSGFTNLDSINKTKEVEPSVRYYYKITNRLAPIIKIVSKIPIVPLRAIKENALAAKSLVEAFKINLAAYYIHYAEKSKSRNNHP